MRKWTSETNTSDTGDGRSWGLYKVLQRTEQRVTDSSWGGKGGQHGRDGKLIFQNSGKSLVLRTCSVHLIKE